MEEIKKNLVIYKDKTKATNEDCAKLLGLTVEQVVAIESSTIDLDLAEQKRVLSVLQSKNRSTGKKIVKILDLFFRFVAMIMPLVTLLLCINGYSNNKILITLISIGAIATSMTILPRNEK